MIENLTFKRSDIFRCSVCEKTTVGVLGVDIPIPSATAGVTLRCPRYSARWGPLEAHLTVRATPLSLCMHCDSLLQVPTVAPCPKCSSNECELVGPVGVDSGSFGTAEAGDEFAATVMFGALGRAAVELAPVVREKIAGVGRRFTAAQAYLLLPDMRGALGHAAANSASLSPRGRPGNQERCCLGYCGSSEDTGVELRVQACWANL